MADNPYINKVEANNQTLIDLTSDTATASDVLEGRTLHLASGAPATGTYRPGDEIEARLEATVGHSGKNLCNLQNASVAQSSGNVSFVANTSSGEVTVTGTAASNKNYIVACMRGICGTDMPVGDFYASGCPDGGTDSTYYMYVYDHTTRDRVKQWDGTPSIAAYNSDESIKIKFVEGHDVSVRIIIRQGTSVSGLVFKPMLRDGRISDNTFEPYVTPTDERIVSLEQRIAALEALHNNS